MFALSTTTFYDLQTNLHNLETMDHEQQPVLTHENVIIDPFFSRVNKVNSKSRVLCNSLMKVKDATALVQLDRFTLLRLFRYTMAYIVHFAHVLLIDVFDRLAAHSFTPWTASRRTPVQPLSYIEQACYAL